MILELDRELTGGRGVVIMRGDADQLDLPENSVDAIVTDPPAAISFMGQAWDDDRGGYEGWTAWLARQFTPAFRALKPGGHIVSWALPRTSHWTARAIELTGFEIRDVHHDILAADDAVAAFVESLDPDQRKAFARIFEAVGDPSVLYQIFGQGFPKSLNISLAIDAADKRRAARARALEFTAWMRSTGLTAKEINELTGSNMGSHYLTEKAQPHVATADMFDLLRPRLGVVPEAIEAMVRERTIESENLKQREVVGSKSVPARTAFSGGVFGGGEPDRIVDVTAAFSDDAKVWEGWGTALKPAVEHWIVGRKPLCGTYDENVLLHGTGALNIGGCRIGAGEGRNNHAPRPAGSKPEQGVEFHMAVGGGDRPTGARWPAHLSLDEKGAAELDAQVGELRSGGVAAGTERGPNAIYGKAPKSPAFKHDITASKGGPSRFFYVAKPPRSEKDRGLDHLEVSTGGEATGREDGSAGTRNPRAGAGRTGGARNVHPTVKSVELMRWLVRLVTPPGGVVLDPFAGSGTTGLAAIAEGMSFVGVEQGGPCSVCKKAAHDSSDHEYQPKYIPILVGRIVDAIQESEGDQ